MPTLRWFSDRGATVHLHKLSFYDKLRMHAPLQTDIPNWISVAGAFLRLDIPIVMEKLISRLDPDEYETEYVLYTDSDVLFRRPINSCTFAKPTNVTIGPEFHRGEKTNTGVMVINWRQLKRDLPYLMDAALRKEEWVAMEQGIVLDYYA